MASGELQREPLGDLCHYDLLLHAAIGDQQNEYRKLLLLSPFLTDTCGVHRLHNEQRLCRMKVHTAG